MAGRKTIGLNMRMFRKKKSFTNSRDDEYQILCSSWPEYDKDDERNTTSRPYFFKPIGVANDFLTISVEVPLIELCPIVNGVKIITKYFGQSRGGLVDTILTQCLAVKDRFSFSGHDFAYLQYLASGIASAEGYYHSFRSLVVADDRLFLKAAIEIPNGVVRHGESRIVLWDTATTYEDAQI